MTPSPDAPRAPDLPASPPAARIGAGGQLWVSGDPAARFPWWSFTKTAIAALAVQLAEEGRLDLDTALPEADFTLRHALTHTAGLPDYGSLPAYHRAVAVGDPPWPRLSMLTQALAQALAQGRRFAAGQGFHYSNIGYMFAREALERVTGQDLGLLLRDRLAVPLGLDSLHLAASRADFAALHWPAAAGYDPGWVYHGCLTGTAADAARLLDALCRGDLLPAAARLQMQAIRPLGGALPDRPWTEHGYGLGLMAGQMGAAGRAIGHSGAGPFSSNAVYHFPDIGGGVTVATFTPGPFEGPAETAARDLALAMPPR